MLDDLEKTLWATADKLRANMDAAEYKHLVLGLIFRAYKAQDKRFAEQIKPAFRTSPKGKIDGYGLVEFPKGW